MLTVGSKKKYTFSGPWSTLSGQYTLETASSGPAMAAMGVDIYNQLFELYGLGESEYDAWFALDKEAYVYVFNSGSDYVRIPSNYVTVDEGIYIDYQQHFITMGLGYLTPTEAQTVTELLDTLTNEVVSAIGVVVDSKLNPYGSVTPMSEEFDTTTMAARSERMDIIKETFSSNAEALAEVARLQDLNDKLNDLLKVKLTEDL